MYYRYYNLAQGETRMRLRVQYFIVSGSFTEERREKGVKVLFFCCKGEIKVLGWMKIV